jgi:hypothetical protein
MIATSLIATLMLATAGGCPADSDKAATSSARERTAVAESNLVQLSGFVELYEDADVLLTDGREIALVGSNPVQLLGGLEVAVTGRFIDRNIFLVESVMAKAQVSARQGKENPATKARCGVATDRNGPG